MKYKVVKVFNNNVVLARQNQQEMILVSKGIGFNKKKGDNITVDSKTIEKVFHELSGKGSSNYFEMIPNYNKEVVGVSEEIIAKAETMLGSLSPNIHGALVDHITFALDRINMGLPIENPFVMEITLLYQEEYDVAELAAVLIKQRLGLDIGDDEKGFIALHLHSARNNKTIRETMKNTRLFKSCVELIIKKTNKNTGEKTDVYQNFIPSIQSILNHCKKQKTMYNPLVKEIKDKVYESYMIAKEIGELVRKEKDIILSDEMIAYIAIDIEKIRQF